MTAPTYGQKIGPWKRTAQTTNIQGQARLLEYEYTAYPFEYDTSTQANLDAYKPIMVIAAYPLKNEDGTVHPKAGLVGPYIKGDAELGKPLGVLIEPNDLYTEKHIPVHARGAWDTSVVPVANGFDVNDPAELRKLNATNWHGVLVWNTLIPTPA